METGYRAAAELAEEPGLNRELALAAAEPFERLGERVVVVPAHACTTVNLHSELLYAGATPQLHWEPVSARGWP